MASYFMSESLLQRVRVGVRSVRDRNLRGFGAWKCRLTRDRHAVHVEHHGRVLAVTRQDVVHRLVDDDLTHLRVLDVRTDLVDEQEHGDALDLGGREPETSLAHVDVNDATHNPLRVGLDVEGCLGAAIDDGLVHVGVSSLRGGSESGSVSSAESGGGLSVSPVSSPASPSASRSASSWPAETSLAMGRSADEV